MEVLDEATWTWFLLRDGEALFLDVYCNLSAFGYSFLIQLTPDELREYQDGGRDYLTRLANAVQYSAPILAATRSPYKGRDLTRVRGADVGAAVRAWRAAGGAGA